MLIPIPKYNEPEPVEPTRAPVHNPETEARVKEYLNVPSWKCVKCKTTMFGRINYCVYCKLRLGIDTPRKDLISSEPDV